MQLTAKTLNDEKKRLFDLQKGVCPLCKNELDKDFKKNHLDHDHALEGQNAGRVRGLLCIRCNPLEGLIKHKFERSGLKEKADYIEWLESLLTYLKKDYSAMCYHPQYIIDSAKKFSRLSLDDMRKEMELNQFTFELSDKKSELVKKYRGQFRKKQLNK
ncbi:MAG: hypothetical protein [Caudoviricetes sp.]|nr:MAG: hypothetical protein [Caudoviricetes sp.]